ncbi:MAG: hypothetical protein E7615_05560 [Ruminococcaceae bacterium]|nr:hypothetical protein [Oscillospiraceae bacterium]
MKKRIVLMLLVFALTVISTGCIKRSNTYQPTLSKTDAIENTDGTQSAPEITDHAKTEPEATSPEITKSDIVGTWMSVVREDNCLYTHSITLNEDGTAQSDGRTLYNSYYMPMQGEEGWYTAPMGFPSDYGTYILNGSKLEITYTRADYGEYEEPYTDTIVISSIKDGKMTVDNRYGVYLRVDTPVTVLSLCETLGVDYSAG